MTTVFLPKGLLGKGMPAMQVLRRAPGAVDLLPAKLLGRGMPAMNFQVGTPLSVVFADAFALADTVGIGHLIAWIEQLDLGEELTQGFVGAVEFLDVLGVAETLGVSQLAEFVDSITLGDSGLDEVLAAVVFSDILRVSDSLTELPNFAPVFVSALVLLDALNTSRDADLTDGLVVADDLTDLLQATVETTEALGLSDVSTNVLAIFATLSDAVGLDETLTPQAEFNILLDDALLCGMEITLDGVDHVAWVLNPQNKAFTRYTNWPFNSFVALGQDAYGLGDAGIFVLEGSDDAGTDIAFRMSSGLMDFGSPEQSNLRHAYMGIVADGDVVLKVISTEVGQRTEDYYRLRGMAGDATFETVQSFSNAVQARFWRFEVENVSGADLELDGINWRVVKLRRKVGGRGRG